MIYLDEAATSQFQKKDEIIVDTISNAMRIYWQNPSSLYAQTVRSKIEECRQNVADFIGAESYEIIFTSGASESNNMAIRGWFEKNYKPYSKIPYIVISKMEHKSIANIWENPLMKMFHCKTDEYGLVDLDYLKTQLNILSKSNKNHPLLVSIIYANNEIGSINDIKAISNLVHKHDGILHIDATQAFGHIPIDVKELDVDMLSASGHKISPVLKGIGILYKRYDIELNPLIYGAQEEGLRGGTENTFGIIGLSKAIDYCDISDEKIKELANKRDYFISLLQSRFSCRLNGHPTNRLPNNISVIFPQDITGEALLHTLDLSGIKTSTGSACNNREIKPSYVLTELGLSDEEAMKTVRFTLSDDITYEDIEKTIREIASTIKVIETDWSDE